MPRTFVFDFAAVLFEWSPVDLVRRTMPALADGPGRAEAIVQEVFQGYGGDWAEFDRGTVEPEVLVPRIAARTGLPGDAIRALVDAIPDALAPVWPTVALVERLRRPGVPMYFLSNMPAPYADVLERRHTFVRAFDDGVFSGRVGLIKPEAAIFEMSARRFGADPAELIFLDDHPANVDAARAAGWNALHFTDAAAAEQAIRAAGWWPD